MEIKFNGKDIGIAIPIILTILGGAYGLGLKVNSSRLEHQKEIVKEYERSSQLDAPGLVSSLNQSAKALTLASHERKAYDTARLRVDEYVEKLEVYKVNLAEREQKITQLTQKIAMVESQYQNQVNDLKSELESYLATSEELMAKKGVALELIPNHVMLGVQSVYDSRAVLNINGDSKFLAVGESYKIKSNVISCDLWLTEVSELEGEVKLKQVCFR